MFILRVASNDISWLLPLKCFGFDYYDGWLLAVFWSPLTKAAAVGCLCAWQRWRGAEVAAVRAIGVQVSYFYVLVLIPQVANYATTLLQCRVLGPVTTRRRPSTPQRGGGNHTSPLIRLLVQGESVLMQDYSVSCETASYRGFRTAAVVLVIVVPLGVPAVLLALLLRRARRPALQVTDRPEAPHAIRIQYYHLSGNRDLFAQTRASVGAP